MRSETLAGWDALNKIRGEMARAKYDAEHDAQMRMMDYDELYRTPTTSIERHDQAITALADYEAAHPEVLAEVAARDEAEAADAHRACLNN